MYSKVLVCTHGRFGEELIRSVEMIVGELKDTEAVSLLSSMSMDDYYEAVKEKLVDDRPTLCLTDLFGGTPCMMLMRLTQEFDLDIICGVNMPVLLEAGSMGNYEDRDSFKAHLVDVYKTCGYDVVERMKNNGYQIS